MVALLVGRRVSRSVGAARRTGAKSLTNGWTRPLAGALLGLAVLVTAATALGAAELLIFERPGCSFCAAFDREVAPIYPLTPEGKAIPARRVDITRPIPVDLAFVKVERFTPVFVLVDKGREIGRIRGYSGDDHFWGMFGVLRERLVDQAEPVPSEDMKARVLPSGSVER